MKTRFIHYNHKITFAVKVDDSDLVQGYAVSKCGPQDQFCKRMGRVKSEGRLNSPRFYKDMASLAVPFKEFVKMVHSDAV